jgi:hypothetical protein
LTKETEDALESAAFSANRTAAIGPLTRELTPSQLSVYTVNEKESMDPRDLNTPGLQA